VFVNYLQVLDEFIYLFLIFKYTLFILSIVLEYRQSTLIHLYRKEIVAAVSPFLYFIIYALSPLQTLFFITYALSFIV